MRVEIYEQVANVAREFSMSKFANKLDRDTAIIKELIDARAQLAAVTHERDEWKDRAESSPLSEEVVDILRSQLAAAQKDAERWRYSCMPGSKTQICHYEGSADFGDYVVWYNHDKAEIDLFTDAAIDQAMGGK